MQTYRQRDRHMHRQTDIDMVQSASSEKRTMTTMTGKGMQRKREGKRVGEETRRRKGRRAEELRREMETKVRRKRGVHRVRGRISLWYYYFSRDEL